ncbi:MAG: hypothetical protein COB04_11100 [Gammaproteobacteria bacterium]|nr:MAG: hypothetical protein COB04_11100 [Gammaproteobacteria bacterium]
MHAIKHSLYFLGVFGIIAALAFLLSTGQQMFQSKKPTHLDVHQQLKKLTSSAKQQLPFNQPQSSPLNFDSSKINLPNIQAFKKLLNSEILNGLTGKDNPLNTSSLKSQNLPQVFTDQEIEQAKQHSQHIQQRLTQQFKARLTHPIKEQASSLGEFQP